MLIGAGPSFLYAQDTIKGRIRGIKKIEKGTYEIRLKTRTETLAFSFKAKTPIEKVVTAKELKIGQTILLPSVFPGTPGVPVAPELPKMPDIPKPPELPKLPEPPAQDGGGEGAPQEGGPPPMAPPAPEEPKGDDSLAPPELPLDKADEDAEKTPVAEILWVEPTKDGIKLEVKMADGKKDERTLSPEEKVVRILSLKYLKKNMSVAFELKDKTVIAKVTLFD